MTLFHLHDDFAATAGESRLTWARASAWFVAALKTIHESIVAAKIRRLQRELMFHGNLGGDSLDEIVGERPLTAEEVETSAAADGAGRQVGFLDVMSSLASALHVAMTALLTFMFPDWYGPNGRYRPGQHYMRGPGPKWRAKRGM